MKKFCLIIVCIFTLFPKLIWTDNLLIFNPNNLNYPNFEFSVAYFNDNYEPIELQLANSRLKINQSESKIDSSILLNSTPKVPVNLTIVFELSSAINHNDLDFYKNVCDHFARINKSIIKKVNFVLISEKPIYLDNKSANTDFFDSLKLIKFYRKSDINKLLNSPIFQNLQSSNNAILLISKSQPKLNSDQFVNFLNSTNTKFFHICLSYYNYPIFEDIYRKTNSLCVRKNDFNNQSQLLKLSTYIITSGPYSRLYSSENLAFGSNLIELTTDLNETSLTLNLFEKDFPLLDISEPVYFFGILDSGIKRTKILKLIGKNRPQIIKNILSNNPNFKVLNFQPNLKLFPDDFFDLRIEFSSKSTEFDSSIVTIYTNSTEEYKLFLYAGKPKSFSKNDLNFVGIDEDKKVIGSELYRLQWIGSHPLDTFLTQYKLIGEENWRLISNKSNSNYLNWITPDIPDTSIQIRLSQLNNKLISEKVKLLEEHRGKISQVSFSPNDSLIATAGEDGFIFLWDSKTGKKVKTLFQSQSKIISSIDWSVDGKYLAIAALDTSIKIWSIDSDVLFKDIKTANKVVTVNFSYDGNYLIARQNDNKVIVYTFPALQFVSSYQVPFEISYFEINPNNHYFFATNLNGNFIIFDYILNNNINVYPSVGFPIISGSFSPSGNNVIVAGVDNKIRIYDIHTGQNVLTIFDSQSPVIAINWLKNRQFIATASGEFIKLWSPSDGKLLETYDQHTSAVYYIKSNNKGTLVASVDQNNIIHLWSPFDFPFIKPLAISIESPKIEILQKQVHTNSYTISNIQITDTLNFYFDDIALNKTKQHIYIDTLTLSTTSSILSTDEKYSNLLFKQNEQIPASMNYIPRNLGFNQIDLNIKSGSKVFKSQVITNVLPNILDRKFTDINFGQIALGISKDTSVFVLQNISDSPIKIDSIKFYNGNDFELVSLKIPFFIRQTGGAFAPTLRFTPTKLGPQGGFFRVFLDRLLPIDIYFYGEGLAPKLDFINELKFISNICEKNILIPIIINNSGNSVLSINEIQIDGINKNEISIIRYPIKIEPNVNDTIFLKWTPVNPGKNTVNVIIKTNLQANNTYQSQLSFETEYNFYRFKLNPNPVIFEPFDDNNKIQQVLTIENNGSIFSNFTVNDKLKYFAIDSIKTSDNIGFIYISFIGGLNKDFYSDTLSIFNDCGEVYKVELIALLKKNQALLTIQDSVDLGVLICESQIEKQVLIQNAGNTDLIISDIYFENQSTNLIVTPNKLTIPPNSFSYISIFFQQNKRLILHDSLILNTNAVNHLDGIAKIPVKGIKEEVSYFFDSDSIDFGNLEKDEIYEKDLWFENNGTIPLINSFKNFNNTFSIFYSEEAYILPNQKTKITIKKNPTTNFGIIIDSILYTDLCGNSKMIILKVNISKSQNIINFSLPYPNPTYDEFSLSINSNFSYNLNYQIYDYLGKIAKEVNIGSISENNYSLSVNLNTYSAGIYLLKLWIGNVEYQFKLIKLN